MKLLYIVIIFCSILGFNNVSSVQGWEFNMPIIKMSGWKGIASVSFKGKITDSQTGKAINIFTVCEIVNGTVERGKLESKGKEIDLGYQTITTEAGAYQFSLHIATLNGQTYLRGSKRYNVLGPASESIIIQISAEGYENKNIIIPKDKIIVGEDNHIDITLKKL